MSAYDLGEAPERFWGHDDYEYWVDVPSTEVQSCCLPCSKKNI